MRQSYIYAETPYFLQALQRPGKFGSATLERTLSQTIEKGLVTPLATLYRRGSGPIQNPGRSRRDW
jgi:hypothetical protein